ncbi:glycosylphosphatidylinositol anchor biosynthesis protein 11 [Paraphaeosphaeria sporulosa]|uniref:Glycosylphosphatidylinositol anchor biosynthesis protein 11 n=1 Tax=Paraphaeosphaeria sporulosa TaxID=1460663 RepID=A0A177C933_9PLEO|nr:glycosylphosphatidylinositol anchor biosynthesis protein 11 [Paraphaeosphaeria sporulosa]OAG03349.1 glycosylphosphatidylinositol anchor biosynthesis protein 11 [Paraphaeosphaeria sporulosa]
MATTVLNSHPKPRAPATPTDVLPTDAAQLYTHIHPILVLSLYALQFPSIVADPVPALATALVPLGILQIAYVAICLPPTGGTATPVVDKKKPGSGAGEKGKKGGMRGTIIPGFLSLIVVSIVIAPLLAAILVLFGAPLTTHHAHTLLAAAHISFLATLPLVYVHGVDGAAWRDIIALLRPVDEVYGGMIGGVVGAWLGAVPIPLDWDREWQKWPVTIVSGAYVGWAVGKMVGGFLKGRKIGFE